MPTASGKPGTAFSHVAARVAKISRPLSPAAHFIDQSRSRPAIHGVQQPEKQCFSPGAAVHGGEMAKPAAAGPLKAGFFLGGQHQTLAAVAAAPSKPSSAGTTCSEAAWITRGVTLAERLAQLHVT